jgi:hypothetical protein
MMNRFICMKCIQMKSVSSVPSSAIHIFLPPPALFVVGSGRTLRTWVIHAFPLKINTIKSIDTFLDVSDQFYMRTFVLYHI